MSDWTTSTLEYGLERLIDYRGKSPPKSPSGIPVISAKVVKTSGLLKPIEQTIAPSYYATWMTRGFPEVGDVVLTTEGPLGEVIQIDSESVAYALGQRIVCLRGKAGILDNTFLRYLLTSSAQQEVLASYATGTTVEGISQKALRSVPINYPRFSEQQLIGASLAALDDKIELNRRMNETLEAMAQAIFRDWFVDFGPVRRKLAGATDPLAIMGGVTSDPTRAAELAALFPEGFNDDGLPEGWPKRRVADVATVSGGKQLDKAEIKNAGPNPVFGGAGVMGFSTRSNAKGFVITVGRVGAYCGQFFYHRGPAWVNNNASWIRPNASVSTEWLLLNLRATDIDRIKRGAAQPFVSNGDVGKIALSGSDAVTTAFAALVGPLFLAREQRDSENTTLTSTRDYLLPRLMSGEVGVRDAAQRVEDVA